MGCTGGWDKMKARISKMQEGRSGKLRCMACNVFDWFIVIENIGRDKKTFFCCLHCGNKIPDLEVFP